MNSKLILILLISVVLRIVAAFYLGGEVISLPGTADQVSYHHLALRVLGGYGFTFEEAWWPVTAANSPTAHWSFLYTFYLVGVYALFGPSPLAARLIQSVVVGLLHPFLAYHLTDQVIKSSLREVKVGERGKGVSDSLSQGTSPAFSVLVNRIPLLAAGVTAVYSYFIYYSGALMTESFYMVALLAVLLFSVLLVNNIEKREYRYLAVILGVVLSIAILLRQLLLLFLPFLFLWLVLFTYKRIPWSRILIAISTVIAIIILAILPFTLFNYARFHNFVLLNTNAGYVLFWANHPIYGSKFIAASEMGESYQQLVPAELRQLDEAALDRELLKQGVQFVIEDPGRYIQLSLSRIPIYFKFWPDPNSGLVSNLARVSSFGIFLPFMLYGLLRPFFNFPRSTDRNFSLHLTPSTLLLYLFIVIYASMHIFTWAQVRYRLPVDAVLVIFAATSIAELSIFVQMLLDQRRMGLSRNNPSA
jgi:hypothetical protein